MKRQKIFVYLVILILLIIPAFGLERVSATSEEEQIWDNFCQLTDSVEVDTEKKTIDVKKGEALTQCH